MSPQRRDEDYLSDILEATFRITASAEQRIATTPEWIIARKPKDFAFLIFTNDRS